MVTGCRCSPGVIQVTPGQLIADPPSLALPATFVGQQSTAEVTLTNVGGSRAEVELTIDAPFTLDLARLELERGVSQQLVVRFAPEQPGSFNGRLYAGSLEIPITGEALATPACTANGVCLEAHFDFEAQQCVATRRPEGIACESLCATGTCVTGTCVGQLKNCDDSDACTIDACGEAQGCLHTPRVCTQPSSRGTRSETGWWCTPMELRPGMAASGARRT